VVIKATGGQGSTATCPAALDTTGLCDANFDATRINCIVECTAASGDVWYISLKSSSAALTENPSLTAAEKATIDANTKAAFSGVADATVSETKIRQNTVSPTAAPTAEPKSNDVSDKLVVWFMTWFFKFFKF
jgi:hypothetical protein